MKKRLLLLIHVVLLLMFSPIITVCVSVSAQSSTSIYGRVLDANTGLPIFNATVLIWDLSTLTTPKPGAGIYFTDENGEYNASSPYIQENTTHPALISKKAIHITSLHIKGILLQNQRKLSMFLQ